MDDLHEFLLDEMNNSYDNDYQDQMRDHMNAIEEFIENSFEECKEFLLDDKQLIEYEEYKKVKDELDELKNKYLEIYSKWKEQS
jgi:hypothetical protein